jgi:hypothetical protein
MTIAIGFIVYLAIACALAHIIGKSIKVMGS